MTAYHSQCNSGLRGFRPRCQRTRLASLPPLRSAMPGSFGPLGVSQGFSGAATCQFFPFSDARQQRINSNQEVSGLDCTVIYQTDSRGGT